LEEPVGTTEGFPRTLETFDGPITIPKRPVRIVSQTVFTDEVLLEICDPDRIAGIHVLSLEPEYSNCVEKAETLRDRAVIGAEPVISLEPDLIFIAGYTSADTVAQLQAGARAPIVRFTKYDSVQDIENNIRAVGSAIAEEASAEALIRTLHSRIEAAISKIPEGATPPEVVSFNPASMTAGAGTLFDDVLRIVGARNVAAENGIDSFGQVGFEQIGSWDPQFIVSGAGPGAEEATRRWILDSPVLAATRAGKSGRVVILEDRLFLSVSHHIAGLIERLVEELYEVP
jgi:iron complex transport system substrate-binding protein